MAPSCRRVNTFQNSVPPPPPPPLPPDRACPEVDAWLPDCARAPLLLVPPPPSASASASASLPLLLLASVLREASRGGSSEDDSGEGAAGLVGTRLKVKELQATSSNMDER